MYLGKYTLSLYTLKFRSTAPEVFVWCYFMHTIVANQNTMPQVGTF